METTLCSNEISAPNDSKGEMLNFVDIETLRQLFEQYSSVTGVAFRLLDGSGNNELLTTGLASKAAVFAPNCSWADRQVLDCVDGSAVSSIGGCRNGLHVCVAPIIVEGKLIATIEARQVCLDESNVPHIEAQTTTHRISKVASQEAGSSVKLVDEKELRNATNFLKEVVHVVLMIGYELYQLRRELAEQKSGQTTGVRISEHLEETTKPLAPEVVDAKVLAELASEHEHKFRR